MYVIQLERSPARHPGVFDKRALLVFKDSDEYVKTLASLSALKARPRRRFVLSCDDISALLPVAGSAFILYVRYRFSEAEGGSWEKDISALLDIPLPKQKMKAHLE